MFSFIYQRIRSLEINLITYRYPISDILYLVVIAALWLCLYGFFLYIAPIDNSFEIAMLSIYILIIGCTTIAIPPYISPWWRRIETDSQVLRLCSGKRCSEIRIDDIVELREASWPRYGLKIKTSKSKFFIHFKLQSFDELRDRLALRLARKSAIEPVLDVRDQSGIFRLALTCGIPVIALTVVGLRFEIYLLLGVAGVLFLVFLILVADIAYAARIDHNGLFVKYPFKSRFYDFENIKSVKLIYGRIRSTGNGRRYFKTRLCLEGYDSVWHKVAEELPVDPYIAYNLMWRGKMLYSRTQAEKFRRSAIPVDT